MIWLGADATDYAVHCEACEEDPGWPRLLHSTLVEGRLRTDADVGFTTCFRGHRIRIRRIARLRIVGEPLVPPRAPSSPALAPRLMAAEPAKVGAVPPLLER